MKRILTILALFLCIFQACHKQDFVPAPLGASVAPCEDSNLIREKNRLEQELFSQIYYANLQLAKCSVVYYKPQKMRLIRASDPVSQ